MPKPITRTTRFGPQPIREVLLRRNIGARDFALSININPAHAIKANLGDRAPAPVYIERAAEALGMSPEALFTEAARDAIYLGHIRKNHPVDLLKRGGR